MAYEGLIWAAIAGAWLIYLVPLFLRRRENGLVDEVEPGQPFSATVTIVRRGTPLESAENGTAVVSTPLNRRAALRELAALDRSAAHRRRLVLVFLALTAAIVGVLAGFGFVPWWNLAVPFGLMLVFLAIARFSVRTMRRSLDARARVIRGGDGVDEVTAPIAVADQAVDENEHSVELTAPIEGAGSLWDPIPITAPTYVSRPLAPRTVRTIDLSAPVPVSGSLPITADALDAVVAGGSDAELDRPRVVGE